MNLIKRLIQVKSFIENHPLVGKHPTKAYWRFLKWQLSQSIYPKTVVHTFTEKTRLNVKKGMTGATGNIYTGLHEFPDMGFVLHFLRKEDVFGDVGANIGSYTILASGHVGARTIAFEPIPETFYWLKKNIKLNQLEAKVHAFNIGLGSETGVLRFTATHDTVNYVLT